MATKVENVQALRGVAILAVLLPHLKVYESRFGHALLGAGRLFQVGNAGVDLFFLISGFVMVTVAAGRFGGAAGAGDFLWRRATRIYPLYWLYSLLVLPLFLLHPEMVNSASAGLHMSVWKAFALLPQRAEPLVAQGWTLIHEMYFYIVFVLLLQVPEKAFGPALLAWAAVVTTGALLIASPGPAAAVALNPLTLEFIAGCFVAMAVRGGINRLGPLCIAGGVLGFIIAAIVNVPPNAAWLRVLWYGVPSALLLYGAAAAEARGALRLPNALVFVGDISYSMYLSHGLVLAALGRLWWTGIPRLGWHGFAAGVASNLLACAVLTAAALIFATLSYRRVEKPLQSALRHHPWSRSRPKAAVKEAAMQPAG